MSEYAGDWNSDANEVVNQINVGMYPMHSQLAAERLIGNAMDVHALPNVESHVE